MSVPYNLRNVKETETTNKFDAVDKCAALLNHALQCCLGDKVQASAYAPLANEILAYSEDVFLDAFEANGVPYKHGRITEQNYTDRISLIISAMKGCVRLDGLLYIGKKNFHWREKKRKFWSDMTKEAHEQLAKWMTWCENEYKICK